MNNRSDMMRILLFMPNAQLSAGPDGGATGAPAAGVPLAGVGSGGLFGESLWLLMKSKGKH
jgi:hypothetical protein